MPVPEAFPTRHNIGEVNLRGLSSYSGFRNTLRAAKRCVNFPIGKWLIRGLIKRLDGQYESAHLILFQQLASVYTTGHDHRAREVTARFSHDNPRR